MSNWNAPSLQHQHQHQQQQLASERPAELYREQCKAALCCLHAGQQCVSAPLEECQMNADSITRCWHFCQLTYPPCRCFAPLLVGHQSYLPDQSLPGQSHAIPSVPWQPAHSQATVAAADQPAHPPVHLPCSIIQDCPLRLYRPHVQGTLALVHTKGGVHGCRTACLLSSHRALCIQDSSRQQTLHLEGKLPKQAAESSSWMQVWVPVRSWAHDWGLY